MTFEYVTGRKSGEGLEQISFYNCSCGSRLMNYLDYNIPSTKYWNRANPSENGESVTFCLNSAQVTFWRSRTIAPFCQRMRFLLNICCIFWLFLCLLGRNRSSRVHGATHIRITAAAMAHLDDERHPDQFGEPRCLALAERGALGTASQHFIWQSQWILKGASPP